MMNAFGLIFYYKQGKHSIILYKNSYNLIPYQQKKNRNKKRKKRNKRKKLFVKQFDDYFSQKSTKIDTDKKKVLKKKRVYSLNKND